MTFLVIDLRIAVRNLWRNRNRTLVALLTVMGGVIAFMVAGGFISWIFQDMREATIHSQLGHIQIVRPGYFERGIADPYSYLLPRGAAEQKSVLSTRGVVSITERLSFSGLLSLGDATVAFVGEGVDPAGERPISNRIVLMAGADLSSAGEMAVLLGDGLAHSIGAKPGDRVVLLATTASGSANAVEVLVKGTFSTVSKEYDDTALRLPILIARKLMKVEGATSWVVLLKDTALTANVAAALPVSLPEQSFEIVPWTVLADFYNKTVTLFSKQVEVVKFIIGLIIVLTISNTQTMSVLERTTEIGTSLAIGLRRSVVMRTFLIEGVIIGIAGGVAGVIVGYLVAQIISAIGIPMPPPPGMAHGYVGEVLVTPSLVVNALFLAFVATLLASVMPAWKASRLNIVDALRTNQ